MKTKVWIVIFAVIAVYTIVATWNSWFKAMLYLPHTEWQPLQMHLRRILVESTRTLTQVMDPAAAKEAAAKAAEAKALASLSQPPAPPTGGLPDCSSGSQSDLVTPQKEECTFDDFGKMDIRTATVLEAERVPKTDKLLKLTIDTGIDKRVIVSGIAEQYSPEEMVGKQICILANLAPRKIRGIESMGMILMARQNDGKMRFITPQETLCNGAEIG